MTPTAEPIWPEAMRSVATCIPEPDALDLFLGLVVWLLLFRGAWWVACLVIAACRDDWRWLRGRGDE